MRAVFFKAEFQANEASLTITGEAAHHLNVVRVKNQEEILILNGQGQGLIARVVSIAKQKIDLEVIQLLKKERTHELSLAIALPKKDAFEDIVKMAVEIGIKNIYPLSSQFSQYDYAPSERLDRVIESALIQSNNYFWPEIFPQQSLDSFIANHKQPLWFFNSQGSGQKEQAGGFNHTILIGPEGGFSSEEVKLIRSFENKVIEIMAPTPIMRAPTAFAVASGYLLSKL